MGSSVMGRPRYRTASSVKSPCAGPGATVLPSLGNRLHVRTTERSENRRHWQWIEVDSMS